MHLLPLPPGSKGQAGQRAGGEEAVSEDRELLELAAKAAGIVVVDRSSPVSLYVEGRGAFGGVRWNPLTDDGDALRLAVKLSIDLLQFSDIDHEPMHACANYDICEEYRQNPYAATRRAIVRAAAEIGRAMP